MCVFVCVFECVCVRGREIMCVRVCVSISEFFDLMRSCMALTRFYVCSRDAVVYHIFIVYVHTSSIINDKLDLF